MKAWIMRQYGGPDVVELADVPVPVLRPNDILVDLGAASVNPIDFKVREGKAKLVLPYPVPLIMGNDGAGVVSRLGIAARRFKVGDVVYFRPSKARPGTFAESIAIDESEAALAPKGLTIEEAASLPLVGLTAWQAIVEVMRLEKGQRILIHAGSGGVGTFAIQLARARGLRVGTTVSAASIPRMKELGAEEIVDYRTTRFEDVLKDYDAVFDTLGTNLEGSFKVLRRGGIVVSVSAIPTAETARQMGRPWWVRTLLGLASAKIRRQAARYGVRYHFLFMHPSGETLGEIARLVEKGAIKPIVDRTFPFAETKAALAYVESGRAKGKVVVKVR